MGEQRRRQDLSLGKHDLSLVGHAPLSGWASEWLCQFVGRPPPDCARRWPRLRRADRPLTLVRLAASLLRLLECIEAFLNRLLVAAVAREVVGAVLDGVGEVLLFHLRLCVIV